MLSENWCNLQARLNGSVQTASTRSNIFESKGNVEAMLNESFNHFKFDSTRFQQAFNILYTFNNFERPVKTSRHLVQQSVELMLKQMLKPFKRALTQPIR